MKNLRAFLAQLRLSQKLTLAVFCVVLVPLTVISVVLFSTVQNLIAEDKMQEVEQGLREVQAQMDKTVDLCNMTTQVFQTSTGLREMLMAAQMSKAFSTGELVDFYRKDIAALEKLVNSNPYLYQVRVYAGDDALPEMMPIFYHTQRMERLAWGRNFTSGSWQFNYADTIYPAHVTNPTPHLMSLVTTLEDYDAGTLGVIEVAVRMDEIIPSLFDAGADGWSAFLPSSGALVCSDAQRAFWQTNSEDIFLQTKALGREMDTISMRLNGQTVWVTVVPLGQIGGSYVVVTPPGEVAKQLGSFRQKYFLGLIGLLLLLAAAIHFIVGRMLRRLYHIFGVVAAVEKGDLYATVPNLGADEVGQLGGRLNEMMGRIVALMEENIKRQVLAKNFEIRALQSQINAHFLYNVLESIKMMAVLEEKYEIADAIQSLGELLRYSMHWNTSTATLAQEVENVEHYLRLINLRFDYQVTLHSDIQADMCSHALPKMTLQPIVENAVVHGIEELLADTTIDLAARLEAGTLIVTITDRGKGMDEVALIALRKKLAGACDNDSGKSIGLKNVQDRIVMEYGAPYGIEVESVPGAFTCVIIRLPSETQEVGHENAVDCGR